MNIQTLSDRIPELECIRCDAPEEEIFSVVSEKQNPDSEGVLRICAAGDTVPESVSAVIFCGGEAGETSCKNAFVTGLPAETVYARVTGILSEQARLDSAFARLISVSAAGKGIQGILDCAYSIVGNPMILIDSSYKLIACNQDIAAFRPDIAEQQKRGFVLSANIEEMKKERIYEEIRQTRYPCYSVQSRDGQQVGWINALVLAEGMEVAQLGVPEINRSFKTSDFEIVHFLCKLLSLELQKNDDFRRNMGYMHSVLLCDLIQGLIPDDNTALLRAEQLGWDLGGRMCLVTVFDAAYGMFDRKARIIADKIHEMIPNSRWAFFENKAVFLVSWESLFPGGETEEALQQYLGNNALFCACSTEFSGLLDVRSAYGQTLRAYEIGCRLEPEEKIHRYEDFVCPHISQILRERGDLRSFCHPGVLKLAEEDKSGDAKLVSTLRAYLRYPDNPGAAAQALFIHKNTLFYRIHKIREDYGLNLSNGRERLWIQMTLEFLSL